MYHISRCSGLRRQNHVIYHTPCGASPLHHRGAPLFHVRSISHYDTLGVPHNATQREIKVRYYELSKRYHPDVNRHEMAAARFSDLAAAYSIVGNVDRRRLYDKTRWYTSRNTGPNSTGPNKTGPIVFDQKYAQMIQTDRFHYKNAGATRIVRHPAYSGGGGRSGNWGGGGCQHTRRYLRFNQTRMDHHEPIGGEGAFYVIWFATFVAFCGYVVEQLG